MTDWVAFEAAVEPVVWGKATYTVPRLPEGVMTGKRRGMLYQISTAKTAPTRAKRIDAMIQGLR